MAPQASVGTALAAFILVSSHPILSGLRVTAGKTSRVKMDTSNVVLKRPFIKLASERWFPWTVITVEPNGTIKMGGITGHMLSALVDYIGFDYEILRPPDGVSGVALGNGSYSGMIGMVHREEVEFALSPFSVTPSRAEAVEFTDPFFTGVMALVTPRPTVKNDIEGFLKPFTSQVWLSILLSLVAIVIAVAAVVKKEMKLFGSLETKDNLSHAVMWAVKAFAQEGSEWLPKKDAGRVVVTTWLLASLVFMSSYSGILIAMLTAPKVRVPIDSLDDLVSQREVAWKLKRPGSFSYDYLKASNIEAHKKAVIGSAGTIRSCWTNREEIVAGKIATICPGTAAKKVFSWDFSINILKEAGLIDLWLNQQLKNVTHCMRPPSLDRSRDEITAISMRGLGGSFLVLAGGLLFASLMFICEVFFHLSGLTKD